MPIEIKGSVVRAAVVIDDPVCAELLSAQDPMRREDALRDFIRLGALLQRNHAATGAIHSLADSVGRSVGDHRDNMKAFTQMLTDQVKQSLEQYLGPDGVVKRGVDQSVGELGKLIDAKLDPDAAGAAKKLLERIKSSNDQLCRGTVETVASVVNVNDEKAPLGRMQRQIDNVALQMTEFKGKFDTLIRVNKERSVSTAKGVDLERFVFDTIAPIAASQSEAFSEVTNEKGDLANCKAGDFLTDLCPAFTRGQPVSVTIEAKNRQKIGLRALRIEMDRAMKNRSSAAVLGILTNAKGSERPIAAYSDTHVVVSLSGFGDVDAPYEYFRSLIAIGYDYARLLAVRSVAVRAEKSVDIQAFENAVERLEAALANFRKLSTQLTGIESGLGKVRITVDSMREEILGEVKCMQQLLRDAHKEITADSRPMLSAGDQVA